MVSRAEKLLARAWQRAQSRILPREGFLEDALAAALEHPTVWPQLSRVFGWHDRLPQRAPSVRTQYSDAAGRTDIELRWPEQPGPIVILELKVHDLPTSEQVGRYLTRDNVLVAGICSRSNADALRSELPHFQAERLLGVITWQQIRQLAWHDAPLEFRQLQYLLDAVGVAMPRTDAQQLTGLRTSLPLWELLDRWIPDGLAAMRTVCAATGLSTTRSDGPRLENGWYAGWFSGRSAIPIELTLWGGVILHDESYPPLSGSFPDLTLHLEIDPRSPLSRQLQEDDALTQGLERWIANVPNGEVRADHRAPGSWAILSARASTMILIEAADQPVAFVAWLRDAAAALVDHGILQRIVALAHAAAAQDQLEEEK